MTRGIGVFGGTFDPIHLGHLFAAQEAVGLLGLERLLFVPAGDPPHKQELPAAPAQARFEMVRLAVADNPSFEVSTLEVARPGPSYTVDTLRALHEEHPESALSFIAGMDSLAALPRWHEPAAILALARIVAVPRGGCPPVDLSYLERLVPAARGRVRLAMSLGLEISATEIRARLAAGRPVRYLVPDSVMAYIYAHGLYGASRDAHAATE